MKRTRFTNKEPITADDLAFQLNGIKKSDGQYIAHCPAHNDKHPSLSISEKNGKTLLFCFAGCSFESIISHLKNKGIYLSNKENIFSKGNGLPKGIHTLFNDKNYVSHWSYKDDVEDIQGYVVRYESLSNGKSVIPYFNKENGIWKPGYPESIKNNRPLYNREKIAKCSDEDTIYIVEGEKCADALTGLGFVATTSLGGSNSAPMTDWSPIAGREVIIWPDKDKAGKHYAASVFKKLTEYNDNELIVKVINTNMIGLEEKEDVFDWIEKGHNKNDILSLPIQQVSDYLHLEAIVIENDKIYKAIDQSENLLLKIDPYAIFQQNNRLVRIIKNKTKDIHGIDQTSVGLVEVNSGYLLNLFNCKLTYLQPTENELKLIDPPVKIVNRYLANTGNWKVRCLTGLIFAPTLRPDGTVLEHYGYDEKTGIFFVDSGYKFPPIKKNATKKNAKKALKKLRIPLQDFPFVSEEDESVILSAILTALIRQSVTAVPLIGFTAPVAGSGKTLLANMVSIIATGKQAVAVPYNINKEEEKKQLFSMLLQGDPIFLIDNVDRSISSDVLCSILTAPGSSYSGRILGKSEMMKVLTNVTFLVTGNNLTFQGDMTRRVLLCTIDPRCENPETRKNFKIKGRLEDYLFKNREQYVNAALTILKAYINAEKPKQNIPQYGSFEEWSEMVRSPLVWLGCKDPNLTRKNIEQDDPLKINFNRIISLWKKIYDNKDVVVSNIVHACNKSIENKSIKSDEYELAQVFIEVTHCRGKLLTGESIGKWLRSNKNKIHNGYKIIKSPNSPKKKVFWTLNKVS